MHTHLMLGCKELKNTSVWAIPEEQFYNFYYIIGGNLFLKKVHFELLISKDSCVESCIWYILHVRGKEKLF